MSASSHPYPGKLIVLEGPDGSGKTTLHAALGKALQEQGFEVLSIREPGGCELAEDLRLILKGQRLSPGALSSSRAEALLFAAARAQLTEEVIIPALKRGAVVLQDRGIGSSLIYQGLARALGTEDVLSLSLFATAGVLADRVLCLTLSAQTAASRRQSRDGAPGDRIESSTDGDLIASRYAQLHELDPQPVSYISAEGSPQEVLAEALSALADLIES